AVATLVAFAAVAVVGAGALDRTRGLLRRDRLTGGALAFALLVLAGLPPGIIGLVAKVVALRPAVDAGLWPLALVAVVAVVLGIAVYLRWFALLLGEPDARPLPAAGDGEVATEGDEPASDSDDPGHVVAAPGDVVVAPPHRGATAVLVLGTGILVVFSVLPGLLLGLLS
ncbi:MAG TPA: hypothetical protein VFL10_04695, partial [Ornithinibacter sp.]|nr:hypothetical protein [Ornithinibacter sp.]